MTARREVPRPRWPGAPAVLAAVGLPLVLAATVVGAGADPAMREGSSAARQSSSPGSPTDVVRESNRRVQEILAAHEDLDEEAEARVREIMDEVTSFERLTEEAVEPFCDEIPPEKCVEFEETFAELLRVSSLRNLGRYRADSFEYLEETIDGETARVETLARYEGDEFTLDYRLERIDGRWRIVNYVFDGVDTVRNYRNQFARLLRQESVDELIERLREKIAEHDNME